MDLDLIVLFVGLVLMLALGLGASLLREALEARRKRLPPADPIAVLDDRFARGEIDEAEWARRRTALTLGPPLEIE